MPSQKKSILFISGDSKINDLEWKMPLIVEYANSGAKVVVWLVYFSRSTKQPFFLSLLASKGVEILYREDLDSSEFLPAIFVRLLRRIESKGIVGKILSQLYFSETNPITKYLGIRHLRSRTLFPYIDSLIEPAHTIFLCYSADYPSLFILNHIYRAAYEARGTMVGVPLAAYDHWYFKTLCPFNLILVHTEQEKLACQKITEAAIEVVGAPQFNRRWLEVLRESYGSWRGASPELPTKLEKVLVILTSPLHEIWKGSDHDSRTIELLRLLNEQNKFLVIKAHPRHNKSHLNRLLKASGINQYQLADGYIFYWLPEVDYVVSFLSFGSLFALAMDKIPYLYWPISPDYRDYLTRPEAEVVRRVYIRDGADGTLGTYLDPYVRTVMSRVFKLELPNPAELQSRIDLFDNNFRPYKEIGSIIEICDGYGQ